MLALLTLLMTACAPCSHQAPIDSADSAVPAAPAAGEWVELDEIRGGEQRWRRLVDASEYGEDPRPIDAWLLIRDDWEQPGEIVLSGTTYVIDSVDHEDIIDIVVWIYLR